MNIAGRAVNRIRRHWLRARLQAPDFTVVSNNCWGAHIYQALGRPYQTPFVGVFLAPECYVKLVHRFRWYLDQSIGFVSKSRHDYINNMRNERGLRYPIGCLGDDVEVQFLHYGSAVEAAKTWERRVGRVTVDDSRLFFKFDDRDRCTLDQLAAFDAFPLSHKVCFVARPSPTLRSSVWIRW